MQNHQEHIKLPDFVVAYNKPWEWFAMKLSLAATVVFYLIYSIGKYHFQPFPSGVCKWINCAAVSEQPFKAITICLLILFAVLYVAEKAMIISTLGLGVLSVIILSLEESNGNPAENGIISLLFLVQFLAYFLKSIDRQSALERNRIQYSIQIVAAVYTLTGISKLSVGGLNWFTTDVPKFALETLRVLYSKYAASGNTAYSERGDAIAAFITHHTNISSLALLSALLIELCPFIMLFGRKYAFVYGFLLCALHLGIYLVMDMTFPTIMVPMVIITMNPLYLTFLLTRSISTFTYKENRNYKL